MAKVIERPFVLTDIEGQPIALFAAASISEPTKGNADHPPYENNTFVIAIQLEVLKK